MASRLATVTTHADLRAPVDSKTLAASVRKPVIRHRSPSNSADNLYVLQRNIRPLQINDDRVKQEGKVVPHGARHPAFLRIKNCARRTTLFA